MTRTNLVHVGGSTYCTREHDSLKISNGKWNWFSRKIGGKRPWTISLRSRAFFTQAVEALAGAEPLSCLRRSGRAEEAGTPEAGPPQASRCTLPILSAIFMGGASTTM